MPRPDTRPYQHYPPEYAALLVRAAQWHEGEPTLTLGPFTHKEVHAARRDLYRYKTKLQQAVDADSSNEHARWLLSVFNGLQLRIEPLADSAKGKTHCLTVHPNPLVASLRQLAPPKADTTPQEHASANEARQRALADDTRDWNYQDSLEAIKFPSTGEDPPTSWRCPACASLNPTHHSVCLSCLTQKEPSP